MLKKFTNKKRVIRPKPKYSFKITIEVKVAFWISILGIVFIILSYFITTRTSFTKEISSWLSDLLLNLGAGFFGAVLTFIFFEIVVNRYKKLSEVNLQRDNRRRKKIIEELRKAGLTEQRRSELIGILIEENLLRGADLTDIDLSNLDLSNCDLTHADLRGAKLSGIRARQTSFHNTQLSGSDLSDSDLAYSDFSNASMRRTNLQRTILMGTNFQSAFIGAACLQGADLSKANLKKAIISDIGVDEPLCDVDTILPNCETWSSDTNQLSIFI